MAQTIIVDISTRGANPVAYTHQGDTGRTFFAEIYENGEAFAVAGYTIKVGAILPADRGYTVIAGNDMVTATKTNDNTTNKIYFTLSNKYSLKAGNGILTLIFTSNTGTPSTIRPINIDLRIQKSADADDTIAGASDFPEGLEAIAEEVFQEYLSTYLPPVAPSASAAANKAADAKLTGEALDDLKSDLLELQNGGYVADAQRIGEVIDDWLDDHPEATTTVQDGAITPAKLSQSAVDFVNEKNIIHGFTIAPLYVGDFIERGAVQPSCAALVNGKVYVVSGYRQNVENKGLLRVFDIATNTLESSKEIVCGHANSIAYNAKTNEFFIAPVFDWSSGTEQFTTDLFKYDATFTNLTVLTLPIIANAVTYDAATESLYFLDYQKHIYKYNGASFDLYASLDFSEVADVSSYIQDFAMYDNKWIMSTTDGLAVCGNLNAADKKPSNSFYVAKTDVQNRFKLGELEGWEFDENGHLIAVNYVIINNEICNAFILEIPLGFTPPYDIKTYVDSVYTRTYHLNDTTLAEFHLETYHIRSVNQLAAMVLKPDAVIIETTDFDDGTVIIDGGLELRLGASAKYTVNYLDVRRGTVHLGANGGTMKFKDSTFCVLVERGGALCIGGGASLNVDAPNLSQNGSFVYMVGYAPLIVIHIAPTSIQSRTLNLGNVNGVRVPAELGCYYGTTKIEPNDAYQKGDTFSLTTHIPVFGYMTSGATLMRIAVPVPKSLRNITTISVTACTGAARGVAGYINGSSDSYDWLSNCTVLASKSNDRLIYLLIQSTTAFSNATNNTLFSLSCGPLTFSLN